jgi:GT2 family glycosyltransferase
MLVKSFDAGLASHQVVLLSRALALVGWDAPKERRGVLAATIDGHPVPRPYATVALKDVHGKRKSVMALALPPQSGADTVLELRQGREEPIAEIALLPRKESGAAAADLIAEDLDPPSRFRLLRFVLDYCRSAFSIDEARLATFCRRLAETAGEVRPLQYRTTLTDRFALFSAPLAVRVGQAEVYLIGRRSIRRNPFAPERIAAREAEAWVVLEAEPSGDELVIVVSAEGGVCFAATPSPSRHLLDLLERDGRLPSRLERYVMRCLAETAEAQPQSAALLRDMQLVSARPAVQLLDPERPIGVSLELAIDDGEGGTFVKGWIRDPHGLLDALHLTSPLHERRLELSQLHRVRRADIEQSYAQAHYSRAARVDGFVAHLAEADRRTPIHQYGLRAALKSGAVVNVTAPLAPLSPGEARDHILGSVSPADITDTILAHAIAPAAAALHREVRQQRGPSELIEIGRAGRHSPIVSIIVPLYRNLSFLRFQIAAFAAEPTIAESELIYVLDSPEQRRELEHLLRGLSELYGLPMKLVVMAANAGYAAANNEAARHATGRLMLLLNSDVIPERSGWLAPLLRALDDDPQLGAIGPKLMFEDGSLQHAGMYFARDARGSWYNDHFYKGFPRDYPAACVAREVPAVTGAALLIPSALYRSIGGFTEDYIIGDYEDSDLCLKVRRTGKAIGYVPNVELYHFERRSIRLHTGYTRTVAASYNRRLHGERWVEAMAELMASTTTKLRDQHAPQSIAA